MGVNDRLLRGRENAALKGADASVGIYESAGSAEMRLVARVEFSVGFAELVQIERCFGTLCIG